jgi:hypothetical protein
MRSRNVRHHVLQARCEQHLRGIEIPRPFSLDVFAASVAARRGRALRVLPLPALEGADGLSGAWVATDTADYVLIDAGARGWHRDLIGLHEISHILYGHGPAGTGPGEPARAPRPGLSAIAVRRILGRDGCSIDDEQEAELTAWLILARLSGPVSGSAGQAAADLASLQALRNMRHELARVVPGAAAGPWADGTAGPARIRLVRRTAEIRDAALALRSYVPPGILTQSRRMLATADLTGTALDAAAEACWLKLAARAARAGAPAREPPHVLPGGSTLREEVRWLQRVAAAMSSSPVQAVAAQFALCLPGRPDGNGPTGLHAPADRASSAARFTVCAAPPACRRPGKFAPSR